LIVAENLGKNHSGIPLFSFSHFGEIFSVKILGVNQMNVNKAFLLRKQKEICLFSTPVAFAE